MKKEIKVVKTQKTLGRGRPALYRVEFAQMGYKLALLGLNNSEIAESLGVSLTTFKTWLKEFPDFLTMVLGGKEIADSEAAVGLYKRATGYEYQSEKLFVINGEVVREPITVHIPPDPGAALNWLKNRQPNLWNDKQQLEHTGTMTVTMDLNGGDAGGEEDDPMAEDTDFEVIDETDNDYSNSGLS